MSLQLDDFLVTGRRFDEYAAFFNLNTTDLIDKKILDCPSGASSFVAEARSEGLNVKGCDILYQFEIDKIYARGKESIELIYKDTSWADENDFNFYGSIKNHRKYRENALRSFYTHYNDKDFLFATLPKLPFEDNSFDLILSSHLLFVYDDRLDLDFHIQAIESMLRVAKEVRIFPLVDYKNSRARLQDNFSPFVPEIMKTFDATLEKVDFEFQHGADMMMKILKS